MTSRPDALDTTSSPDAPPYRYNATLANEIERRWQERWSAEGTFHTPNPSGPLSEGFAAVAERPKFYVLDMFPYPSGAGLHVGHPLGYIGTDVFARFLQMEGYNVLHPFGYDAFGLPAEQYALESGQHPRITTEQNIANMRRQLGRLGLGHDLRRELSTTDPEYYRWTQWIFLQIFNSWFDPERNQARPIADLIAEFEANQRAPSSPANPENLPWGSLSEHQRQEVVNDYRLAYITEAPVNWSPGLGTVLANEEVTAEGRSAIGNFPVYRRPLRQWMLRITAYAERLIDDLAGIDWPEPIKAMQRNWIGKSRGAEITFGTEAGPAIDVFTTRPDTLFGATYVVLAPEHQLVDALVPATWPEGTPQAWQGEGAHDTPMAAVEAYRTRTAGRSERDRIADTLAKTGVFTGGYALNPATGARVPVFIADYVLTSYGTGAIMAVPAHDQRDFEFASLFGLPVLGVVAPPPEWLEARSLAASSPASAWPEAFEGYGVSTNSTTTEVTLDGWPTEEAIARVVEWLTETGRGEGRVTYRLRDWLFSRQRYWGEPFPIVYGDDGLPIALPDDQLPVLLPEMDDFTPRSVPDDDMSEPEPPLGRATEWAFVDLDLGDGARRYRRELNTMPQWAGSCWYYLRFLDPTNESAFVDPDIERYWMGGEQGGVDLYVGGVEHAVLHLLYARFWHKVLYDLGYVSSHEPFHRLYNQGYILAAAYTDARGRYVPAEGVQRGPDGSWSLHGEPVTQHFGKMGKSLKNSVSPDEIYEAYGADTLRLYEMSMGPLDSDRPWNTTDISGAHRFLQRLWRNIIDEETGITTVSDATPDDATLHELHSTIEGVRKDYRHLRFNTALAKLIELNNYLTKSRAAAPIPRSVAEPLVLMLAPLAPHVGEELWRSLGHAGSLAHEPFPTADPDYAATDEVEIPVQVNGKLRFRLQATASAGEQELIDLVLTSEELAKHKGSATVERVIAVPGRLVNVVLARG
jgi:leucyl-tRNA synthetase